MKKTGLFLISILTFAINANAQWTTSGSNIYWNVSGGKLGIGTTAPAYNVDIQSNNSNTTLRVTSGSAPNSGIIETYASGVGGFIESNIIPTTAVRMGSRTGQDLYVATNNTNRMTIKGSGATVGYVGINNTSPNYQLDVTGTISSTGLKVTDGNQGAGKVLTSDANGVATWQAPTGGAGGSQWTTSGSNIYFNTAGAYVGIGTATPANPLDVVGTISTTGLKITGGTQGAGKVLTSDANGVATWQAPNWVTNGNNINYVTGNVGIGSTNPDAKLTVNGTIHTSEVKVDLSVPGPDYVFEKNYNLLSLDEIKTYIDQNKHLPEIPSAKEMEKNGIQLGEMNMLLLKKIEELTLHILTQESRIKELESKVK